MSKVLFMNGPAEGHINPTLALVEELIRRGEKVTYFTTDEYREKIKNTGAEFRPYKNFMKVINPDSVHKNVFGLLEIMAKSCKLVIPEVLESIKGECYDYVIHDSMFGCGNQMAQIFKIPAVCSCTTFAMSRRLKPLQKRSKFKMLRMMLEGVPHIVGYHRITNEMKKNYKIKKKCMFDTFFNSGALNIVYTSKYFQPDAEMFDDSYKFIGPSIIERKEQKEFPFEKLRNKPVIFISLGTINNNHSGFYKMCFEAFRYVEAQVVMSVGKRTSITGLSLAPENFIIMRYVPQVEILKHTAVFITHGGMNSTSEALYYGVPLVVIPMASDQFMVANQVRKLGAGEVMDKEALTAKGLRDTTAIVMQNKSYKEGSLKIAASFKEAGGYKKAVDEIFHFKKSMNII
jgi:MGT family glycosyltransferase